MGHKGFASEDGVGRLRDDVDQVAWVPREAVHGEVMLGRTGSGRTGWGFDLQAICLPL